MQDKDHSDLLRASNMKLRICEIFKSVQGEGVSTGVPVIFVRFSWCNLACTFCDSAYTWKWKGKNFSNVEDEQEYLPEDEIVAMTANEVKDEIDSLADEKVSTVVITGGEPLLQQNSSVFIQLLRLLKKERFRIEIETNGTITPNPETVSYVDQFNVSLKLSNSGNKKEACIKEKPCLFFANEPKTWFKFVISCSEDVKEVLDIQKTFGISSGKILLMPEGQSRKVICERSKEVIALCMENGFRFSDRLQVRLWGKTRKV